MLQCLLKNWLCDPQARKNDVCIIGKDHHCNGIEVEVVVHIIPADCPLCGISNADPVVISRAKAVVIVATYKRLHCTCGWKSDIQIEDCTWNTPTGSANSSPNVSVKRSLRSLESVSFHGSIKGSVSSISSVENVEAFVEQGWSSLTSFDNQINAEHVETTVPR